MSGVVRTLLFSTLYPSSARPTHGIFVETRQRELMKRFSVETRVVAPVPWFPLKNGRFGEYAAMARTPEYERRNNLEVWHPRYIILPRAGMIMSPFTLALSGLKCIKRMMSEGYKFDLIDAHYFYPDGVAAAWIAKKLGKPLCITARGSDLNILANYTMPRNMIRWAANQSFASIGVCQALVDVLRKLGFYGDSLMVMRNGVDFDRFNLEDQHGCRAQLGVSGSPLLLSVGRLIEAKGHHLIIEAMPIILRRFPNARLVIIGEGEMRAQLESVIVGNGLQGKVSLVGSRPNEEMQRWFCAADALVLASRREGWANVLLESMACGTPVVATDTGGTPEVVAAPEAGVLVSVRTPHGLAEGVFALMSALPVRKDVNAYAKLFSWDATAAAQYELFQRMRHSGSISSLN